MIKYKQVLFQIQEGKGQTVEISGEYRDAIEERRREFKSFESDFKVGHPQSSIKKIKIIPFSSCFIFYRFVQFCVCDSAIKTKFEKHTQKGIEIMSKVTELLQNVSESAKIKRYKLLPNTSG